MRPSERAGVNLSSDTCQISDASNSELQMPDHRPVPQIGRGPQQFARVTHNPMTSPVVLGQAQQPPPDAPIAEQLQDLAMEIYCRVVSSHISAGRVDAVEFRYLAKHAQTAAKAYFQSLGVQFDGQE